jgi:Rrf2 family protein
MQRAARLGKQEIHALKALVALAVEPAAWQSVTALAAQQELPAAMLEQLLLRLRRAGLIESRRGRLGGYRLSQAAARIPLKAVLLALAPAQEATPQQAMAIPLTPEQSDADQHAGTAAGQVAAALERRLQRALDRELSLISLEDLLFDLRSTQASLEEDGGLMLP